MSKGLILLNPITKQHSVIKASRGVADDCSVTGSFGNNSCCLRRRQDTKMARSQGKLHVATAACIKNFKGRSPAVKLALEQAREVASCLALYKQRR
jgi:hypothetical protein